MCEEDKKLKKKREKYSETNTGREHNIGSGLRN